VDDPCDVHLGKVSDESCKFLSRILKSNTIVAF
jgi:hypothetical protein